MLHRHSYKLIFCSSVQRSFQPPFMVWQKKYCSKLLSRKGIKETPQSLKKIGRRTSTLDQNWAKNPKVVISNAHKLTEVEILNLLEKVVTMPDKRLEKILKTEGAADETFIQNLTIRLPHFLTSTLVQIAKV